jgi:frataxin
MILSEGQDSKEGTGAGQWVYLRDMSTLADLLLSEVGVDLSDPYAAVPHLGE